MRKPAVFLDKDGTLIHNVPHNVDPARIRLADGAEAGVQRLHRAGYHLVVVSNQSGVAFGRFALDALAAVTHRLHELLAAAGVPLLDAYYCPHHPEGKVPEFTRNCPCRKPRPGLLLRAAREHRLDLAHSWMVGDILDDIEAGHRAGCATVLVDNGNESEWNLAPNRVPHFTAADLLQAAEVICGGRPRAGASWEVS